ncbi:trehalose-phosphatase [Rhodospirillum centenum]|uniref:Trehalose 6-phosphate phosphatase n=1 Tax=Rhodospirillum centenum (strain ATCC 51521 / SW) TaxID=414684 RepID=B6IT58_RHOCS|nr:trehalose-phosphatase [Rhodospirillum centenum]ACI98816.1 trehalose-phosphatase [Rhodospirillum centenum SW]
MQQSTFPRSAPQTAVSAGPLDDAGIAALADRLAGSDPALFLDFDGTLTEIVQRPDLAELGEAMRGRLRRLARLVPVAIVSGRDLDDVRTRVGVEGLIYAGSHGFDIDAPSGRHRRGEDYRPALERAGSALEQALAGIPGALVERKRYAVAVHTRLVEEARKPEVADAVRSVAATEPQLRRTGGKELVELRPDLPWDKGRAVLHLIGTEGLGASFPVYVGDDLTDEDAFAALRDRGMGILVGDHGHPTAAAAMLPDIPAVGHLLDALSARLGG